jgi:hypothetical protein
MRSIVKRGGTLGALILCVAILSPRAYAAAEDPLPANPSAIDPQEAAHREWHKLMHQIPTEEGCFHASYPNLVWEEVACASSPPSARPKLFRSPVNPSPEVAGYFDTGYYDDNVVRAPAHTTFESVLGSFKTKGVKSETGVGVAKFGGGGNLGPNEYSVQINTNSDASTSACYGGAAGCKVWQQFIYTTSYPNPGDPPAILMEYWLINYAAEGATCPSGFLQYFSSCEMNSRLVTVPHVPAADLGKLALEASVPGPLGAKGVNDELFMDYGGGVWKLAVPDRVLDLSFVWTQVEFNVLGNAGGSRADFNKDSAITVDIAPNGNLDYALVPTCVREKSVPSSSTSGLTAESNNLNLGDCNIVAAPETGLAFAEFIESNAITSVDAYEPLAGQAKGGTTLTLQGSGFFGVEQVLIGGIPATHLVVTSDSELSVETPEAKTQIAEILLVTTAGQINVGRFEYWPEITGVSPNRGSVAGGEKITVTGLALADNVSFYLPPGATTDVQCTGSDKCTMKVPASKKTGTFDIVSEVRSPYFGFGPITPADRFTYY